MSALKPDTDQGHDLGTTLLKWGTLHVGDIKTATFTATGNVAVAGNLTVTGTSTSIQVANLDVEDPLIKLARGNSADTIDIGFYGVYNDGSEKYAAFARDANDSGKFKLLDGITSEPTGTAITGGSAATLVANVEGALTGNASTATALATGRTFAIGAGPIRAAAVSFDGTGNLSLTSTIADDQILNDMLANPGYTFSDGGSAEAIEIGQALVFQGTSNELEVSRSNGTYTFGLPSSVSGLSSVSATALAGELTGNASTATALATARTFEINAGPIRAAAVSFQGTGNVQLTSSIADDQITNDMLANPGVTIGDGSNSETLALGGEFEIKGTTNEVDVVYSTTTNDFTVSLPSAITASLTGNASTASALASSVNVGITAGPVRAANVAFDGSGAVALTSTIADDTITDDMLAGSISNGNLANSSISLGGVSISLGATNATPSFDLQSATGYPTAQLVGQVSNSQLGGSIANDKLSNSSITVGDGSNTSAIALGGSVIIQGTSNEVEVGESSGTFTIGLPSAITASLTGNADTATKFAASKNIGITAGPVTAANIAFDGSGHVALQSAIAADAITNTMIANDHLTLATTGSGSDFDIHLGDTLNINGTADEVDVTIGSDAITIGLPADVTIADDLDVGGSITSTGNVVVGGNLTAAAATVTLGDTLLELGVNNTSVKDHGFYSQRAANSFCGFFFDETDDKFKPFTHDTEPSADVVAVSGNYAKGAMDVGDLECGNLSTSGKVILGTPTELTIDEGEITVTKSYHKVDTEGNASTDGLGVISGGVAGMTLILQAADSARTVIMSTGGNIKLAGDASFNLDHVDDTIQLICVDGSIWCELSRSDNS